MARKFRSRSKASKSSWRSGVGLRSVCGEPWANQNPYRKRLRFSRHGRCPFTSELSAFAPGVIWLSWKAVADEGHRLCGIELVFPGRDGVSLAIRPSTHAQARVRACAGARHFRSPAAAYGRHLLNERGANPRDVQALLDHKSIGPRRTTRVDSQRLRSLVGNPGCPS
jgi:hypothetical protein